MSAANVTRQAPLAVSIAAGRGARCRLFVAFLGMTQAPDTHLVERAGLGKYFDRGPEASEERWQCSIVLTPNGGIGVVAKYGWRANEFGYPELLVHETNGVQEWRDEGWFRAEGTAVAFGVLVIDGVQGRNAFDHEAVVEVSTFDANTNLADDVELARVIAFDGEVLDDGVPLRAALVKAGIVSAARLGPDPDGGSDMDGSGNEGSDGSGGGEQDGSVGRTDTDDSRGSGSSGDSSDDDGSEGGGSGDGDGSGDSSESDSDLDGDSDLEGNECGACGACWRIGEQCRLGCRGEQ